MHELAFLRQEPITCLVLFLKWKAAVFWTLRNTQVTLRSLTVEDEVIVHQHKRFCVFWSNK